jgi:Rieske Fe-S protein
MTKKVKTEDRRGLLASVLMWTGVGLGYGLGAFHFLRYLVPLEAKTAERELFVGPIDQLEIGQSRTIRAPNGDSYVMARIAEREFRVLSDVCPHLGCRVHWEADNERFFCPCHAGVFDATGKATGGPPAEADQNLARLETVIRGNSVFVLIKES